MRDAWVIQKALYAALASTGDAWYDEVPEDEVEAPYGVLGSGTERPMDTHSGLGTEETATLDFWSRTTGSREVKDMMARADVALHHQVLSLEGGGTVQVAREFADVLKEEDPDTGVTWRHGVVRYRIKTLEERS